MAEITREELFLLLESYKNTIALNTTLLERMDNSIKKQDEIIEKQRGACNSITKLVERIEGCSQELNVVHGRLLEGQENLTKKIEEWIEEVKNEQDEDHTKLETVFNTAINRVFEKFGKENQDIINGIHEAKNVIDDAKKNISSFSADLKIKTDDVIKDLKTHADKLTTDLKTDITSKSNTCQTDHSKITTKVYISWIALLGSFISIIALVISLLDKNETLKNLSKLVSKIAIKLAVEP